MFLSASLRRKVKVDKLLLEIAKNNCYEIEIRGDLERRYSDNEDFVEISVWCLKQVLLDAFEAGKIN